MATDRNPLGLGTDDAESAPDTTTPGPEAEDTDTEGQMMIPDGTGRFLARDRERDIRRHLSNRQQEQAAKEARRRK
ncbi:MAG TPA: hypothetical protein VM344_06430 [Vitreimonas sp.]|nr:hypothetical protein [Vitreimonas sp.]